MEPTSARDRVRTSGDEDKQAKASLHYHCFYPGLLQTFLVDRRYRELGRFVLRGPRLGLAILHPTSVCCIAAFKGRKPKADSSELGSPLKT